MDFTGGETNEDNFLRNYPGILIPCENIESLQKLILLLYERRILERNETFLLKNVPDNILEILNTDSYFETTELAGIKLNKGQLKFLEKPTKELL